MSFSRTDLFLQEILASWKFVLSFLKSESAWEMKDYPIRTRQQDTSDFTGPERLRPCPWVASIIRWNVIGCGATKAEAIQNLQGVLDSHRASGWEVPRPGIRVPLQLAPDEQITLSGEVRVDFITRVLELEWAWLSDESSLWDFHAEENNDSYYQRILAVYGVDVSDVPNANISEILKRIPRHGD